MFAHTDHQPYGEIIAELSTRLPIELEYYDDRYLKRRIDARLRRTDAPNFESYLSYLDEHDEEEELLLESLSINVTGFFRNPEVWTALKDILRELTNEQRRVNVWSAPCADGREPYSVALLALDDPDIREDRLSITGTDVSEDALATARAGTYQTGTTNDIASELQPLRVPEQYVKTHNGEFQISDPVRSLVDFQHHDLIQDRPLDNMDIVLCRNFLIYIHQAYETVIFDTISSALGTGGHLIVGMTESSVPEGADDFNAIDRSNRIYERI